MIEAARNKAKEAERQRSAALVSLSRPLRSLTYPSQEELEALKLSMAEKSCAPDENDRATEAKVSARTSEYDEKIQRKEVMAAWGGGLAVKNDCRKRSRGKKKSSPCSCAT